VNLKEVTKVYGKIFSPFSGKPYKHTQRYRPEDILVTIQGSD
jgi:hypothetical protein